MGLRAGGVFEHLYYSPGDDDLCTASPVSVAAVDQLKEVRLNGYRLNSYGDYDDRGQARCVMDERGVTTTTTTMPPAAWSP